MSKPKQESANQVPNQEQGISMAKYHEMYGQVSMERDVLRGQVVELQQKLKQADELINSLDKKNTKKE